jgi:hypothetical protein
LALQLDSSSSSLLALSRETFCRFLRHFSASRASRAAPNSESIFWFAVCFADGFPILFSPAAHKISFLRRLFLVLLASLDIASRATQTLKILQNGHQRSTALESDFNCDRCFGGWVCSLSWPDAASDELCSEIGSVDARVDVLDLTGPIRRSEIGGVDARVDVDAPRLWAG